MFLKFFSKDEATLMTVGDLRYLFIIRQSEVEDMLAYPAGELFNWAVIAIRDDRSNVHCDNPFRFEKRTYYI